MTNDLHRLDEHRWLLPKTGQMRAEGLIFSDEQLIKAVAADGTLEQVRGMACLPGVLGSAMAMPDAHQGYGFPIGGVAAFDPVNGVVSPGGVGYDINCGVRLLRSKLSADDLSQSDYQALADGLAAAIPAGVGTGGKRTSRKDMTRVLERGAAWAVQNGMGSQSDLEFCEAGGALPGAVPDILGNRAIDRGANQLGSLGAGNHFVELGRVDEIMDQQAAAAFGLFEGQLVLWIHTGSRGLGHQVCGDYLKKLAKNKDAIIPKDSQLIAAPPDSDIGSEYLAAMASAANFAFANRQILAHMAMETIMRVLGASPAALGLGMIYDVAHNIAKLENHKVNGKDRMVWVHRKGATRALGPGHPEVPARYKAVGQPVLVPGDMGRASYILRGSAKAEELTFASSAHGAGRRLSRNKAKSTAKGRAIDRELAKNKILVRAASRATLAEEMPEAYKDVNLVAGVMHGAGIAPMVARTRPLVVIKG